MADTLLVLVKKNNKGPLRPFFYVHRRKIMDVKIDKKSLVVGKILALGVINTMTLVYYVFCVS